MHTKTLMKGLKNQIVVFLLSLTIFSSAQDKCDTTDLPIGLFFHEFSEDVHTSMGHRMFELKKCSIAVLWSDDQGAFPLSELGIWSLKGDTVIINFERNSWTFVWRKSTFPEIEPNFYSSLEMTVVPWIYTRVSRDIFTKKSFVKKFAIKGKAEYKNGKPMLRWSQSSATYITLDNLSTWEKKYLNKEIEVLGILVDENDGHFKIIDWEILPIE